jgi:DNA repair exonuclease SbcCD ATPase subunit
MELKKLILKNFRAHKNLSLEFNHGVTGICGGNGTGKSSIVEAIMFLLTGEGYGRTKNDMLSVGTVSGYVIGHLTINNKEAVLERHIDTAKVNFKYDGKVYKKSSEVVELWGSLFQIDKHIVQNIVISNQGEIALLFNGDDSTKEKLFQKIFMVPNTSKLRDIIWNNYIKTAPLEYAVKDPMDLKSDIHVITKLIEEETVSLDALNVDQSVYEQLIERKSFLTKVASSSALLSKYDTLIPKLEADISTLTNEKDALSKKISHIDIEAYRQKLQLLDTSEPLYRAKQVLLLKKKELSAPSAKVDPEIFAKAKEQYTTMELKHTALNSTLKELNAKIAEYETKGLDSGVCPTCGTMLDNLLSVIEHTKLDLDHREKEIIDVLHNLSEAKNAYEAIENTRLEWEHYRSELKRIDDKLEAYETIEYSEDDHNLYRSVIKQYDAYTSEIKNIDLKINTIESELNSAKLSLAGIVQYDKARSEFTKEQADIDKQISDMKEAQAQATAMKISIATRNKELEVLSNQLKENDSYIGKNAQRKKYMSLLNSLYELFHTTKFPRALIQTYASTVSVYMNDVLDSFDFPHSAKVNESFGIDIYDKEGNKLPSISGGQQVMVGFSLRMALHHMFVGAFPFMIIDEGSYGLAADSLKKYFHIISKLNKTSKFKQVIVIDHHKELSDHVDHIITLT